MTFPTIEAAQAWSTKYRRPIFVEIQGANGVLEVWPGGRKIWWDDTLSDKTIERKRRSLTPDTEFEMSAWEPGTGKPLGDEKS